MDQKLEEFVYSCKFWDFPDGSDGKESACNMGDLGSIPGLGRSPEEQHGNPLQFTSLENPMDRGAWPALIHFQSQSFLDGQFFGSFFNSFCLFGLWGGSSLVILLFPYDCKFQQI